MDRTTNGMTAILPKDVNALLVEPVTEQSLAIQIFEVIPTDNSEIVLPVQTEGVTAEFVGELEDYATDDITMDEIVLRPRKIGKTVPASEELVDDSDPSATELINNGLIDALSSAVDRYTFGNQGETTKAFAGLENVAKYGAFNTNAIGDTSENAWDLDYFVDAQARLSGNRKSLSYYVAHSDDIALLNKIKESDGSRRNVLQSDPTLPGVSVIGGVPIMPCDFVPVGTIWGFAPRSGAIVLRNDSELLIDRSVGFKRDEVWFKGRMRVAFGVLDTSGIVKIKRGVATG